MKKLLSILGAAGLTITSTNGILACKNYSDTSINTNQLLKENYNTFLNSREITDRENRSLTHSEFKPTGYYLQGKHTYTVTLNRDLTTNELGQIKLSIGQWGQYKNINQNRKDVFTNILIPTKANFVTFYLETDGVLYLADNNLTDLQVTNVTAEDFNTVVKVPTFKVNKTDQNDFINDVLSTNSPFVEFVSKHYIATMQTDMIKNKVLQHIKRTFNDILLHWDNIWKWTNEIYGLNEEDSTINHKYPQYIHIANSDKDSGYANTTNGRIMFQNNTSAGQGLFLKDLTNQWGLWHETGHTYQTPQYRWNDLTEVTVNISSLYIQQKMGVQLSLFQWKDKQKAIKEYLAKENDKKDFNNIQEGDNTLWMKLAMFWQLQMAFGENFYPLLSQTYRAMLNTEKKELSNTQVQIQHFIIRVSEISGYNLTPFFQKWGLQPTEKTKNAIKNFKPLTKEIWNNITDPATEHNPIVQEIVPIKKITPVKEITAKNVTINFGDEFKTMSAIKKIFTLPNLTDDEKITVAVDYNSSVTTFLKDKNTLLVPVELQITQKNKIPNIQRYLFKLNKLNNTIIFQGISDGYKGVIGLNSQDKMIKFDGNTEIIHYYFKHEMYYTIRIKNNLGELIKNIVITGDQNFVEIIKKYDLANGIKYDENYQISIIPVEGNRVQIFNNDNYQPLNGPKTYIIKNDNLVEIE